MCSQLRTAIAVLLGVNTDNCRTRKPMQDFEKLGLFYLGKTYDLKQRQVTPNLVLYESKDLTTHAVCVGMTGSGKTGLGIALLEEAAIDGIPVIAIDPKGDLGNLLLGFPELRPRTSCRGSIRTRRAGKASRSSSSPPRRPSSGAKGWPPGARTARGLRGSATRSTWRSTRRGAAPGCR